ncbi:MAG: VirB4-like conjugal transfer ATPase, CD1110 family, partial [Clostridium perfringens]
AKDLAVALELYTKGSLSIFANKTNVNTNSRFIIYDIKDLGKQLKTMGMLIVLDAVWNRITKNRAEGRRTWIYMDEIYLLFANEYSATFLFELYKRARKWGGIPTGITQNVEDLLQSDLARKMLSNSDFLLMLNQAPVDREELAKLLKISDTQLSYITNSNEGEGLLFSGNAIIPFIDKFPKNTKLYKMMTTKVDEIKR